MPSSYAKPPGYWKGEGLCLPRREFQSLFFLKNQRKDQLFDFPVLLERGGLRKKSDPFIWTFPQSARMNSAMFPRRCGIPASSRRLQSLNRFVPLGFTLCFGGHLEKRGSGGSLCGNGYFTSEAAPVAAFWLPC